MLWQQNLVEQQITKQNPKLEAKFFKLFSVLHSLRNQAYKLELLRKWKIHNIFYLLLLEYDITKKERIDETTSQLEFEVNDKGKEYKVKQIWDNAVYAKKSVGDYLPRFYYLVL